EDGYYWGSPVHAACTLDFERRLIARARSRNVSRSRPAPKPESLEHASFVTQSSSVDSHVRHKKPAASLPSSSPFLSLSPGKTEAVRVPGHVRQKRACASCHNHQNDAPSP